MQLNPEQVATLASPFRGSAPHDPHIRAWNEVVGPKFLRFRHLLERNASAHHDLALSLARPGERVLDIGCGFGDTARELLARVGPRGRVTGVDCTAAFLELAALEAPGADWMLGDAGSMPLPGPVDRIFSRFGTMFFSQPLAAFQNLRHALRPGGTLVFVTWRPLEENPWLERPRTLAHRLLPLNEAPRVSCGPGPFSQADPARVGRLLEAAGFRTWRATAHDAEAYIGSDLDEAVAFQLAIGPAGERVREASLRGPVDLQPLSDGLRALLMPHTRPDGVWMPSSSWTYIAR